jgi:hypothetical protein
MPPDYRIVLERHTGSPNRHGLPPGALKLLRTPRVDAVHRMGDRVIMKSFCVERAGHLQHVGRLLA